MELTNMSRRLAALIRRSYLKPNLIKLRLLCSWRSGWTLHQITDYNTSIDIFMEITGVSRTTLLNPAYSEYQDDFVKAHIHTRTLVGLRSPEGKFVAMYEYSSRASGRYFKLYLDNEHNGREQLALFRGYETLTSNRTKGWKPLPAILSINHIIT